MRSVFGYFNQSVYLLRLDDACVGFDYQKWMYITKKINTRNIKPLIAVVPKNADPELMQDDSVGADQFWSYVADCSKRGWALGLHGYTHQLHPINIADQIVKVNSMSEFATLDFESQSNKITQALSIFKEYNLTPTVFVAPAHSFDQVTLKSLKKNSDIRCISDGHFPFHCIMDGFCFIPQQLWKFRWLPFGLYTVCLHPSSMSYSEIDIFFDQVDKEKFNIKSFKEVAFRGKCTIPCWFFNIFQSAFLILLKIKRRVK